MGLIEAPVGVVSGAFEGPVSLGGAENKPLLKSKPATLPYPTKAQSVVAATKDVTLAEMNKLMAGTAGLTIGISDCEQQLANSFF